MEIFGKMLRIGMEESNSDHNRPQLSLITPTTFQKRNFCNPLFVSIERFIFVRVA